MPRILELYDWVVASVAERNQLSATEVADMGKVCQVRHPEGGSDWYRFGGYSGETGLAIWTPYTPPPVTFAPGYDPRLTSGKFSLEWTPTTSSAFASSMCLMRWGGQADDGVHESIHNSFWIEGNTFSYYASMASYNEYTDGLKFAEYEDYQFYIPFGWTPGQRITFTFNIAEQSITIAGSGGADGTYQARDRRAQGSQLFIEYGPNGASEQGSLNPFQEDVFHVTTRKWIIGHNLIFSEAHVEYRIEGDGTVTAGGFQANGAYAMVPPLEGVTGDEGNLFSDANAALTFSAWPSPENGHPLATHASASMRMSLSLEADGDVRLSLAATPSTEAHLSGVALGVTAVPSVFGVAALAGVALTLAAAFPLPLGSQASAGLVVTAAPTVRGPGAALDVTAGASLSVTAAATTSHSHALEVLVGAAALGLAAAPRTAGQAQAHPLETAASLALGLSASPRLTHHLDAAAETGLALVAMPRTLGEAVAHALDVLSGVGLALTAAPRSPLAHALEAAASSSFALTAAARTTARLAVGAEASLLLRVGFSAALDVAPTLSLSLGATPSAHDITHALDADASSGLVLSANASTVIAEPPPGGGGAVAQTSTFFTM